LGDWRIIANIEDGAQRILVVRIGDAQRSLPPRSGVRIPEAPPKCPNPLPQGKRVFYFGWGNFIYPNCGALL